MLAGSCFRHLDFKRFFLTDFRFYTKSTDMYHKCVNRNILTLMQSLILFSVLCNLVFDFPIVSKYAVMSQLFRR